jgi:hypothetical protein
LFSNLLVLNGGLRLGNCPKTVAAVSGCENNAEELKKNTLSLTTHALLISHTLFSFKFSKKKKSTVCFNTMKLCILSNTALLYGSEKLTRKHQGKSGTTMADMKLFGHEEIYIF